MLFVYFYHSAIELGDKGAWTAHRYVDRFCDFEKFQDNCERIHVKDVTQQQFIDRFEKFYKPVVIEGVQVRNGILNKVMFYCSTNYTKTLHLTTLLTTRHQFVNLLINNRFVKK